METYQLRKQINGFDSLSDGAKTIIKYANADDGLRVPVTVIDGIDLTSITEIVEDAVIKHERANPMFMLASMEARKIIARTPSGNITFWFAVEASPDGIWSEMSTSKNDPKLLNVFH